MTFTSDFNLMFPLWTQIETPSGDTKHTDTDLN